MAENFEAIIGANIRDFQRAMREVDREIRETAMGAEADIGADISEFMSEMAAVDSILTELAQEHNIDIEADVSEVIAEVAAVEAAVAALPNETEIEIEADISDFVADTAVVRTTIRSFLRDRILIPVEARINNFQRTISRLASNIRSFAELATNTLRGIGIALSPTLSPMLASLGGLIGQLGPMIGVMAGSTFALASAFGTAGIGAVAFGSVAVTHLKDVFNASSELKKLQEELGKADSLKERNKILKEMKAIQGSLNKEQVKAMEAMNGLKKAWAGVTKDLEKPTLQIFTKSLNIFGGVLKTLKPMFAGVTSAFNNMMDSLGKAVKGKEMMAFFNYLNTTAGPMTETVFKSIGNLMKGFFNMMTAFAPLSESTAQGFLRMSEGFAAWAAGLSESTKFQSFINYVNENMPKVRAIFRDAIAGMIYMFAAFGPAAADWMTNLQNMMARFKEWAKALGENQQFQKFIDYLQVNAPKVSALIGNIITFLVNLGVALAPMGSKLLDIVNSFLTWSSAMLETYPWIGKVLAVVIVLTGALIAIAPNVIALATLFRGAGTAFSLLYTRIITQIPVMVAAIQRFVVSVATATARVIVSFAQMVARAAVASAQFVARIAVMIAQWVLLGARSLAQAARVAAAWALSTGAAMARAVASMIATAATFVARWALMGAQALLHAARMAAAWFIALGPVGWVIGVIVALVILIIANWDKVKAWTIKTWNVVMDWVTKTWSKIKSATKEAASNIWSTVKQKFSDIVNAVREKMNDAWNKIKEIWGNVMDFFEGIDLYDIGVNMIQGLINGIGSMASSLISKAKGVVGDAIEGAKNLLGINSPSRVFMEIGKFTGEGMVIGLNKMSSAVGKASQSMASAALIDPQQTQFAFDTSLNGSDLRSIRHDFSADIQDMETPDPVINVYNEWDGEKVVSYVERGSAKRARITDGFGGK